MKLLLPHRYKKAGALLAPSGFSLWFIMQLGYVKRLLFYFFGQPEGGYEWSALHITNIAAAVVGVFAFLGGLFFVAFSKEKVEDEMVQKTRLDSFQAAAFLQFITILAGFVWMFLFGDPGESGLMLFFVVLVLLFWLTFIGRFNYILHVKYRQ